MAFAIKSTLQNVQDYFAKSGYFPKVQIGEPKQPFGEEFAASIFMSRVVTTRVFLNGGTGEVHVVTLRIYHDLFKEPSEDVELKLADVVSRISSDVQGEFDLGATVTAIDIAGMHGTAYGVSFGHVSIGQTAYRVADIVLPLIVNDSATAAP